MADLGIPNRQWLVSPNKDIELKWLDVSIQEKKSRINRMKQDIEDLQRGRIIKLEADLMMLEKELKSLVKKRKSVEIGKAELTDAKEVSDG